MQVMQVFQLNLYSAGYAASLQQVINLLDNADDAACYASYAG